MKLIAAVISLALTTCHCLEQVEDDWPDTLRDPMESDDLFEGDIELGDSEEARSAAIKGQVKRWPNGVVHYSVDPSLENKRYLINQVIWHIQNNSCVRFVESNTERNRIVMDAFEDRCSSSLGQQGGKQALHLADGCWSFGTALHEVLHACGFLHEHTRSDRDNYVRIEWNNIRAGKQHNFRKRPEGDVLLSDFDYDSIMIYRSSAFAKRPRTQTVVPLQPGIVLRHSSTKHSMTPKDKEGLNKLYNC